MDVTRKPLVTASIHSYVPKKYRADGQNTDESFGIWPMEKKWMFVALGALTRRS